MSLVNAFKFTKTIINWAEIEKATKNQYRVVGIRPYIDKKGLLEDGYVLTLMVLHDDFDYGTDKNGEKREDNKYRNFDATVLSRKNKPHKGDIVRLLEFDSEHSFAIGFDLLLRFKNIQIIPNTGGNANA